MEPQKSNCLWDCEEAQLTKQSRKARAQHAGGNNCEM